MQQVTADILEARRLQGDSFSLGGPAGHRALISSHGAGGGAREGEGDWTLSDEQPHFSVRRNFQQGI